MDTIENRNSLKLIVLFSVLVAIIIIVLGLYDRIDREEKSFESASTAMGTYVQQTVYGKNAENAANAAVVDINNFENLISWRIDSSEIAKINANSGKDWVDISDRTMDLLLKSIDVSKKSDGAYDLTILPISKLWGFGGENQRVPSTTEIESNLPLVDYSNLRVNKDVKRAKLMEKDTGVDLGSSGKGAACDVAIEAYKNNGAEYGIIAVGGSVGVYGTKSNKTPWKIAVRDPFKGMDQSDGMAVVKIKDGFLSTSGSYEKNFEKDGITYHHIIDPKTGYPVQTDLVAVSVLHSNGAISDLLSTACYVLGREESIQLLEYYEAQAIFIDKDKNVFVTDGIRNDVTITSEEFNLVDW